MERKRERRQHRVFIYRERKGKGGRESVCTQSKKQQNVNNQGSRIKNIWVFFVIFVTFTEFEIISKLKAKQNKTNWRKHDV